MVRFSLLVFLVMGFAWAQDAPLTYAEALAQSVNANAEVLTARVDLASAERDLARLEADPLALRVPLLQAEHAAENARQALRSAELSAQDSAADAYADALEADTSVELAEAQRAIAQTELEATQIRFEAGAATALDVERAQNALRNAERDLTDAQESRTLAYNSLSSLLGLSETPELSDTVPVGAVPSLEETLADLETNSQLVGTRQAVELSEAQLAAVDNAFSAKSDIDAAKDALDNATTRQSETRRTLGLSIRQSYIAVVAAQNRVGRAEADLQTAQETLNAQQVRFDAGSISLLELEQSKLDLASARSSLESARHGLASSLRQLRLAVQGQVNSL